MGAKKRRTFLRGTVEDDLNFFWTNYFCVTIVLTSKQSRYLASLGREEATFSGPDSLCGLYVCIPNNPKCVTSYVRAAHENLQIYSNLTFLRSIWP